MDKTKEYIDETVSKRPLPFLTNDAIRAEDKKLVELRSQINNLSALSEAMGKDEDWQRIVKDSYRRMEEIAYDVMMLNPSDSALTIKFATRWGQFNERKRVTEEIICVKSNLEKLKRREKSFVGKIAVMLKKLTRQNGE